MPYRRNLDRETTLLSHWRMGRTVKTASTLTGIPEGSTGYYYARFNKRKDLYKNLKPGMQEPPRSTPSNVASAALSLTEITNEVRELCMTGDFAKARDFLQMILLYIDLERQLSTVVQNQDPERMTETLQHMMATVRMQADIQHPRVPPAPETAPAHLPQTSGAYLDAQYNDAQSRRTATLNSLFPSPSSSSDSSSSASPQLPPKRPPLTDPKSARG